MTHRSLWLRGMIGVAVALTVALLSLQRYRAPLPSPLTFDLVLDAPSAGRVEPLITSGRTGAGDFFFVRMHDAVTVTFGYESWGEPGRFSPPVKIPASGRIRLVVEMPGLTLARGSFRPPTDRLRVAADGVEVFNTLVHGFVRNSDEIHFASNPIGGTACAATLHGRLLLADGRELRGAPVILDTWPARLVGWCLVSRWPAIGALLLGVAAFLSSRWLPGLGATPSPGETLRHRLAAAGRRHRVFVLVGTFATFVFAWRVSYGTLNLTQPETFGEFYDFQAESLLQGRLDVPWEAIGGEAFVYRGKNYGYFGVTPALLRVPFVVFDVQFGRLTRLMMVACFAATLLACYLLLRTVRTLAGQGDGPPPTWATLVFVGGAGLGSTLFYLGSRAYVYHEAILCGVMFALFACWAALRHWHAPGSRAWLVSLACGVMSVHARPPTGFFALTFLGAMAVAVLASRWRDQAALARRQVVIAALCGAGVFSFNLLSYAKFETFEGCPLRYNVQYDAARLARIDGKQFHLVNLPIAVDTYLVRPNFRVEASFPFFFIGTGTPEREWRDTKIDYHDPTLGFPYAMPGLFGLATLGGVLAFRRLHAQRLVIAATWAAGVPMTFAMFIAIALTHRYTADFCPFLIVAAAWGVVGIDAVTQPWRNRLRAVALAVTAVAVLITFAITLHHQGKEVWGVPDHVRTDYAALQQRVDAFFAK